MTSSDRPSDRGAGEGQNPGPFFMKTRRKLGMEGRKLPAASPRLTSRAVGKAAAPLRAERDAGGRSRTSLRESWESWLEPLGEERRSKRPIGGEAGTHLCLRPTRSYLRRNPRRLHQTNLLELRREIQSSFRIKKSTRGNRPRPSLNSLRPRPCLGLAFLGIQLRRGTRDPVHGGCQRGLPPGPARAQPQPGQTGPPKLQRATRGRTGQAPTFTQNQRTGPGFPTAQLTRGLSPPRVIGSRKAAVEGRRGPPAQPQFFVVLRDPSLF